MAKAQKGDLIRIVDSEDAPKGKIYEVIDVHVSGDVYVNGTFEDGSALWFYEDEFVIHRKAGEEDSETVDFPEEGEGLPYTRLLDAEPTQDVVNSPSHYTQGRFETIEVIEEITQGYSDGYVAYCVGNALKYLARAPFKHGEPSEDLTKAAKYIEFALARLQTQK